MDPRERFSATVDDYRSARPGYEPELLAWIWKEANLVAGDTILDMGCGTGISTRWLAESGLRVLGCEPNEEMLSAARNSGDGNGRIEWIRTDAESLDLGSRQVKAIVGGQSFHWLDLEKANPRFRKVLVPGGRVIAFWNVRDEKVPTMKAYFDFLMSECPAFPEQEMKLAALNFGVTSLEQDSATPPNLEDVNYVVLKGTQQIFNFEELVKRVWSSSYVRISVTDEVGFNAKLRAFFDTYSRGGTLLFDYKTVVFSYLP
jgi:SAM-dependent methyltransferase